MDKKETVLDRLKSCHFKADILTLSDLSLIAACIYNANRTDQKEFAKLYGTVNLDKLKAIDLKQFKK